MTLISIHTYKTKYLKKYYGATQKVYRQAHVDRIIEMHADLHYLREKSTRCRLVPAHPDFLKKAIPAYNSTLANLQAKYPNIIEFQRYRKIYPKTHIKN